MRLFSTITRLRRYIAYCLHKLLKSNCDDKFCCVYKSEKGYKVITLYQIFEECKTEWEPVFFLSSSATIEELADAVFFCLGKSCTIVHRPIASTQNYLKLVRESSLKSFYASTVLVDVQLNPQSGMIKICPWKQSKGRGMEPCSEKKITTIYKKGKEKDIANSMVKILNEEFALKKGGVQ